MFPFPPSHAPLMLLGTAVPPSPSSFYAGYMDIKATAAFLYNPHPLIKHFYIFTLAMAGLAHSLEHLTAKW